MNRKIALIITLTLLISISLVILLKDVKKNNESSIHDRSSSTELEEKCSTSADSSKHFWAQVCIDLPKSWVQKPLGYEDHIVFVPYNGSTDGTSLSIMRNDESAAINLDAFVKDQIDSLIQEYQGHIITKKSLGTDKYYLEGTLAYNGTTKLHTYTYFYHDKSNHYYWQIIFLVPEDKKQNYDDTAPRIVKSFRLK